MDNEQRMTIPRNRMDKVLKVEDEVLKEKHSKLSEEIQRQLLKLKLSFLKSKILGLLIGNIRTSKYSKGMKYSN